MKPRVASVLLAFVFITGPVFAQSGGNRGGTKDLAAELAALTARVSKLEGNIVASDLAGTYNFVVLDTTMTGVNSPQVATITTSGFRAILTLNGDATGSVSGLACEGSMLTVTTGVLTDAGGNCSGTVIGVTWTYADGIVTVTFLDDGDEIPFAVALGGRFLLAAGAPFHAGDPSSDSILLIATRLQ